jgi:hypothetical protein
MQYLKLTVSNYGSIWSPTGYAETGLNSPGGRDETGRAAIAVTYSGVPGIPPYRLTSRIYDSGGGAMRLEVTVGGWIGWIPLNLATANGQAFKNGTFNWTSVAPVISVGKSSGTDPSNVQISVTSDVTAPTVVGVSLVDATHITVAFSESMDPATSQTVANFAMNHGVSISAATLRADGVTVQLTTSPLTPGTVYTLTVSNLLDTATPGDVLTPNPSAATLVVPASVPPTITSVTVPNDPTHVKLVYSEAVDAVTAQNAANYALDHGVTISAASLAADNLTVTLTVTPLVQGITYTLTVNNVLDRETIPAPIAANTTVAFALPAPTPPVITSVTVPTDVNHIIVVYDEAVDAATATAVANYAIDSGVTVSGAALAADNKTVTLTVSALARATTYNLSVSNVLDRDIPVPSMIVSPTVVAFTLPVGTPPVIASISAPTDATHISVLFSDDTGIDAATAESAANYALDNGVTVSAAALQADQRTVVLTVSALTRGPTYHLTVNNVQDRDTPFPSVIAPMTVATLVLPTGTPPTLASITVPVDVNHVSVLYSEAMDAVTSANAANYRIDNGVTISAAALQADTRTVILTVSSLTQGTIYHLTVNNVLDREVPIPSMIASPTVAPFALPAPTPPTIGSVAAVDRTHVRVVYAQVMDAATTTTPTNYVLSGGLTATAASLAADNITLTLTVSAMAGSTSYTLSVSNVQDQDLPVHSVIASPTAVAFVSPTPTLPTIASISNLNLTQVTVVFSMAMDPATAGTAANYALGGGVTISTASVQNSTTILLNTTTMAPGTAYTLTVNNVQNSAGWPIAANSTAGFTTPMAPTLVSVTAVDSTHVSVAFSKAMGASAAVASNYAISNGVTVSSVAAGSSSVTLTVSALPAGINNTLSVMNVQDTLGITISPNPATGTFTYTYRLVLAQYTFPTTLGSNIDGTSYDPTTVGAGIDTSTLGASLLHMVWGAGLPAGGTTVATIGYPTDPVVQVHPTGGVGATPADSMALAVAYSNTMQFTIQPAGGKKLVLSTLEFDIARGNTTSVRGYGVESSVDGFGTAAGQILAAADLPTSAARPNWTHITVDLSAPRFQNLTAAVTFNLYFYVGAGGNSLEFDNVTLYGGVTVAGPPPVVAMTSPTGTYAMTMGQTVTLAATATQTYAGGSIASVTFYDGATNLGTAAAAGGGVYTLNWNTTGAAAGNHSVTAVALDNVGAVATSSPATIIAMTVIYPTVAVTAPTSPYATYLGRTVPFTATATTTRAGGSISSVQFYDGATLIGTGAAAGGGVYTFTWTASSAGTHNITVRATDNLGAQATSAPATVVTVTILYPSVAITSPTGTITGTQGTAVLLVATASTTAPGGSIASVQFYDGLTLLGAGTTGGAGSYTYTWNTTGAAYGLHTLTARATDNFAVTATSAAVGVTFPIPPSLAITAPASGATCTQGNLVAVQVTAIDWAGTVSSVEIYDGGAKLGNASYSMGVWAYSWNTSGAAVGSHALTAKATDNSGASTMSAAISIVVNAGVVGSSALVYNPAASRSTGVTASADANTDGIVDGRDYGIWQNGYGLTGAAATGATGDFNGDGTVDGEDYGVWQNNYGHATDFGDTASADDDSIATTPTVAAAAPVSAGSAPRLTAMTPASGSTVAAPATLTLTFDQAVTVAGGAVEISGLAGGPQKGFTTSYDAASGTLTLTFTQALAADRYTVRVVSAFVTGAGGGAALDGETGNPAAATLPSGDGQSGGDAMIEFEVK